MIEESAFDALRRATERVRGELDRLIAPAGLRVETVHTDGSGWMVRLLDVSGHSRGEPVPVADHVDVGPPRERAPAPRRTPWNGGAALMRSGSESLTKMLARAGSELRLRRMSGEGGLRASAPTEAERLTWLAWTLVGDTVLALRHLGHPEDGPRAEAELCQQFEVFLRESDRAGAGDTRPFLDALDAWTPPPFPRGPAFLRLVEAAHA